MNAEPRSTPIGRVAPAGRIRGVGPVCAGLAALLSLALGAYIAVTTAAMVPEGWSALPFYDQWHELIFSVRQVLSPWIFSQHHEHRWLFPRLLFAIDTFAFAETQKFTFFCNLLLPLGLVGLLLRIAGKGRGRVETVWLAGLLLALLFSAMQAGNFLLGANVAFFGVELAAAASLGCIVLAGWGWKSLAAAIGFEAIALYSLASGAVVLVLAVPLALWARRPRSQAVVLAAANAALLALYLDGYVMPGGSANPMVSLGRPGAVLRYAASELGNPIGKLVQGLGLPDAGILGQRAGQLGLALFCWTALLYLRRRRSIAGPRLFFFGLAGFAVGVAFLTALGRLDLGAGQALMSRYATPMLLSWLSLGMLAIVELRERAGTRLLAMGLSLPVLIALSVAQAPFVDAGVAWTLPRRTAETALLAGVNDVGALGRIYPDTAWLRRQAAKLRARHLSIFADPWSRWLDTPLARHVRFAAAGRCRGGIAAIAPVPADGGRAARARGWAWDTVRGAAPRKIVLTDRAGRVVGYGLSGFPNPGGAPGSGWRGHAATAPGAAVTAYALLDGERLACRLTPVPRSASR